MESDYWQVNLQIISTYSKVNDEQLYKIKNGTLSYISQTKYDIDKEKVKYQKDFLKQ